MIDERSYQIILSKENTNYLYDSSVKFNVRGWENALAAFDSAIEFVANTDDEVTVDLIDDETGEILKTNYPE